MLNSTNRGKKMVLTGLAVTAVGLALLLWGTFGSGEPLSAVNGSLGPVEIQLGNGRGGFTGNRDGGGDAADGAYVQRSYSYDGTDIHHIVLSEDNADVTVGVSGDGRIHLNCRERDRDRFEIRQDGDTLTITRNRKVVIGFLFLGEKLQTELLLPEGGTFTVSVSSDNGDIHADNLALESLELTSNNGDVTAEALTLSGQLHMASDNGKLTGNGVTCGGATLQSDNGSVQATDFDCRSLDASTDNGSIRLKDVSVADELRGESDNGSVQVENVAAGKAVELRSNLGDITGTLAGSMMDYRVHSSTDLGENNLPSQWGRGGIQLQAITDLGDIDLRFLEDGE